MRHVYILLLILAIAVCAIPVLAQSPAGKSPSVDTQTLLEKIQQLEKRVQELEARDKRVTEQGVSPGSSLAEASSEPSLADTALQEATKRNTGLQIRGFGQITFLGDDLHGDRPTYTAGNLTLLLNSQISQKLSAIAEVAVDEEGYGSSEFGTVLERALLQYEHNDYLKISAGRYFSSIGYYNTAYFNSDWAQTTMRRPIVSTFQDEGGLMPMQRNGVSMTGRVPSGKLGLHYVAELGGGDVVRNDVLQLGNEFPIRTRTGFNIALFARPANIGGLQVGASFYHDSEIPLVSESSGPLVRQNIYSAHAVYHNSNWEFLNEAYLVHHNVLGYREFNVPAFFTQISRKLTPSWRPYFRFTYVNAGENDPMLPDLNGRATGVETGVRYNFSEWAGMKLEYNRMHTDRPNQTINFGGTQLVFTF